MVGKSITERFFLLPQGNMSVENLLRARMIETTVRHANNEWTDRNPENVKHGEDIGTLLIGRRSPNDIKASGFLIRSIRR